MRFSVVKRPRRLVAIVGLGLALTTGMSTIAGAASLPGTFSGQSYGAYVDVAVGPLSAERGYSARVLLTCPGTNGVVRKAGLKNVSIGPAGGILKSDSFASTVTSTETATTASARDTANVVGLNALGGLITADSLRSVAALSADTHGITLTDVATFVNLKIAGRAIPANIPANTRIKLPGVGTVFVKRVVTRGGGGANSGFVNVEMLRVVVQESNSLGLPVGSIVSIGSAYAYFERGAFNVMVGGQAYGTDARGRISTAVRAGLVRTAPVYMTCRGTDGVPSTNEVASTGVNGILSTGDISDSATSIDFAGGKRARVVSLVEDVSLLAGLVHANSVQAVAIDTVTNGTRTSTNSGSSITGLRIAGKIVPAPAPNTRVSLVGIGYLVLNEQVIPTPTSRRFSEATGIHLHVTHTNTLGLPVGAEILIAHAQSLAFPVHLPAKTGM